MSIRGLPALAPKPGGGYRGLDHTLMGVGAGIPPTEKPLATFRQPCGLCEVL